MNKTNISDDLGNSYSDKDLQASFWSMLFLISELAIVIRGLETVLREAGVFDDALSQKLQDFAENKDNIIQMYKQSEYAFNEKYQRARYLMDGGDPANFGAEFVENRGREVPTEETEPTASSPVVERPPVVGSVNINVVDPDVEGEVK
jgi:hypothetical protein